MERSRPFGIRDARSYEVPYKVRPSCGLPVGSFDVRYSCVEQPRPRCLTCFPTVPSSGHLPTSAYVNLLDVSIYGGVPFPLCTGVPPPSRWLADLRYTFSTPLTHKYPSVTRQVIYSSRVGETVSEVSRREDTSVGRVQKRAVRFLYEMKANISKTVCKIVAYILFKVFRRLMTHLLVCPAQMAKLQEAEKVGIPIVYLPLHRSHLDYLLTTWTLWHFDLRLPHIASGDNLNLSGFGWLLRGTGAFFIHRGVGDGDSSGSDVLYRSVLHSYMTELLRTGLSVEFFLEGTRSRFGRTLLPKNGLISNVITSVQQGLIKDVFLVPISFTYDQIAEGNFIDELMGMRKQRESVWRVFKGIVQSFGSGKCGCVRLHFGNPLRLSDCMNALKNVMDSEVNEVKENGDSLSHCYRELLPWHRSEAPEARLIRAVGYHLIYEAQMQTSLSVASVLSALVLCGFRDGGDVCELRKAFEWFADSLVEHGFDVVGWIHKQTDGAVALRRAFEVVGDSISVKGGVFWLPSSRSHFLRLAYYKNAVLPALSITSVVALSVLFHRGSLTFSTASVLETALSLCDMLRYDVIFCKPCENLRTKISDELSGKRSRLASLFSFKDNDSFSISTSFNSVENAELFLRLFANVLRPFVQSLYFILQRAIALAEPFEGRDIDFVRFALTKTSKDVQTPFRLFHEALNSDSLNSSLKLLREKGVLVDGPRIAIRESGEANAMLLYLEEVLCKSE